MVKFVFIITSWHLAFLIINSLIWLQIHLRDPPPGRKYLGKRGFVKPTFNEVIPYKYHQQAFYNEYSKSFQCQQKMDVYSYQAPNTFPVSKWLISYDPKIMIYIQIIFQLYPQQSCWRHMSANHHQNRCVYKIILKLNEH